jgi:hypothetical protein
MYPLSKRVYIVDKRPVKELFDISIRQGRADTLCSPKRVETFRYSTKGILAQTLLVSLIGTPISFIIKRYCFATS